MVLNLKICGTLMSVMNVGDSGPVGVAMQGCEFGEALLVRHKVRKVLHEERLRVKHHMESIMGEVFIFFVFQILLESVFRFPFSGFFLERGVMVSRVDDPLDDPLDHGT